MTLEEPSPDVIQAWQAFLEQYARGGFPADQTPRPPPLPSKTGHPRSASKPGYERYHDTPVYGSVEIDCDTASRVRDFYARHRFLPPPRGATEAVREECVEQYSLTSEAQVENFQSVVDLCHAVFGGIITFTLFDGRLQRFMAVAGDPSALQAAGLIAGMEVLPETSMCGHSVLWSDQDMKVADLRADWRHEGNPYVFAQGGLRSYMGSVVTLPLDPTGKDSTRRVSVGVINLLHTQPIVMTPERVTVLKRLTRMLEKQIKSTWDGRGRLWAARVRSVVSDLMETILVEGSDSEAEMRPGDEDETTRRHAQLAAEKIIQVLPRSHQVTFLDLRSILPRQRQALYDYMVDSTVTERRIVLGHAGEPPTSNVATLPILCTYLNTHGLSTTAYDRLHTSGLEPFLPSTTAHHTVVPLAKDRQPLFCVIVSTDRIYARYTADDEGFIRTVGTILRSYIFQRRVIAADAAKTTFVSSISHEIRTPLHGLLSGLDLIRQSGGAEQIEVFNLVDTCAKTLECIVSDVLDFAKLSRGDRSKIQMLDLRELSKQTMLISRAEGKGIVALYFRWSGDRTDWSARVDRARFQRILLNGISNAIKHTRQGSITVSLKEQRSDQETAVILDIKDTGVGIPPRFLKHVFEPFTQASHDAVGTGIGLYVVRGMVEEMGGQVSIESTEGVGTRFRAVIPGLLVVPSTRAFAETLQQEEIGVFHDGELVSVRRGDIATSQGTVTARAIIDSSAQGPVHQTEPIDQRLASGGSIVKPFRVLVVEDNEISRKILVRLLISRYKANVVVKTAVDGVDGTEMFKAFCPEVVLTDVSMPRMDGITASREMRKVEVAESRPRAKIYAITGLGASDAGLQHEALNGDAAIDGWFTKGQTKLSDVVAMLGGVVNNTGQEVKLAERIPGA